MLTYDLTGGGKYELLYRGIREDIRRGRLKPGDKLPSKRSLAEHHGVSVVTVENAYGQLVQEGYVVSRQRSGYFVAALSDVILPRAPEPAVTEVAGDESQLPEGWLKTVRQVLADSGHMMAVKPEKKGCAQLQRALAGYLRRYRGMEAEPEQIIIGAGAEDLYGRIAAVLGRNSVFAIEDPSYGKIAAVYENFGAQVQRLPMGEDGIRSDALQSSRANVLHVTPFHSFPSGITAPAAKRLEYIRWLRERGSWIVEDDFDSEFSPGLKPLETLYSMAGGGVIYMNTFSKSISPAIRAGYMILPPELTERYNQRLGFYSCPVPVFDQLVIARYIDSGQFERHLNRQRRKMRG
jgi:GntR family transcriptional regulator/MocR family aminotransferase